MHEIHQLGDFWFQDLHCLLIDLHSIGLLIAFHLRQKRHLVIFFIEMTLFNSMYEIVTCGIAREQLLHV